MVATLLLPSDYKAADRIKCAAALKRLTGCGKDSRMDREEEEKLCNMLREVGHPHSTTLICF